MGIINQGIGWSQESKLLQYILKQLQRLSGLIYNLSQSSGQLTSDELAAIQGANSPNNSNPFATINDIIAGGGCVDVTYEELVAKILASELVCGQYYTITDFATVHCMVDSDENYILDGEGERIIHTGANEPLVVLATSVNTLAVDAYSLTYPDDAIKYNWDWVDFILPQFKNGKGAAPTGFKGVITRREDTLKAIKTNYDFREITYRLWDISQPAWDSGTTYNAGEFAQNGTVIYYAIDTSIDIEPGVDEGWESFWKFVLDLSNFDSAYLAYNPNGLYISSIETNIPIVDTDVYIDRTMFEDNTCSNIVFDECIYIPYVTYGSSCSDMTYGTSCGSMIYGSYCSNMTYGSGCQGMTYGTSCGSMIYGSYCSNMTYGSGCQGMTYGTSCGSMIYGTSCGSMTYGSYCASMTYGSGCQRMTYGSECYNMTYGTSCESMTYGTSCESMTYGTSCNNMTYGSDCGNMTYGSYCNSMTYGSNCGNMTYGSGCGSMTFGDNCGYYSEGENEYYGGNNFGDNCYNITFGDICLFNTLGEGCHDITFPSCSWYNKLENGVNTKDYALSTPIYDTNITHQVSNTGNLYQTYIDDSGAPAFIITTDTIGKWSLCPYTTTTTTIP